MGLGASDDAKGPPLLSVWRVVGAPLVSAGDVFLPLHPPSAVSGGAGEAGPVTVRVAGGAPDTAALRACLARVAAAARRCPRAPAPGGAELLGAGDWLPDGVVEAVCALAYAPGCELLLPAPPPVPPAAPSGATPGRVVRLCDVRRRGDAAGAGADAAAAPCVRSWRCLERHEHCAAAAHGLGALALLAAALTDMQSTIAAAPPPPPPGAGCAAGGADCGCADGAVAAAEALQCTARAAEALHAYGARALLSL